jgi:hypothetical protein
MKWNPWLQNKLLVKEFMSTCLQFISFIFNYLQVAFIQDDLNFLSSYHHLQGLFATTHKSISKQVSHVRDQNHIISMKLFDMRWFDEINLHTRLNEMNETTCGGGSLTCSSTFLDNMNHIVSEKVGWHFKNIFKLQIPSHCMSKWI